MRHIKGWYDRVRQYVRRRSIQVMIAISFTVVSVIGMALIGVLLYTQFTNSLRDTIIQENTQLVNQIALNINSYTARIRGISDSMYYNVIKKADLSGQDISRELNLLYDANNDILASIACYSETGELIAAAPIANPKDGLDVTQQEWFVRANTVIENIHFSNPHVQNLFEESSLRHDWVISLSRMVELHKAGLTSRGVLLVDMNYSGIEMIFQQMSSDTAGYVFLVDKAGEIIYHPKQNLIFSGLYAENNFVAGGYGDGLQVETFNGLGRQVIVKTVSYTGWKVVCVIPNSEFSVNFAQVRVFSIIVTGFAIFLIIMINAFVSSRVANPIKKLDKSVRALEQGNLDLDIYIGGPYEIEHLGNTIATTVQLMRRLMDDIVVEQERLRKSEFDALQAQINPHFLYNTLDSIVWMIECGRTQEAISMVTALASLFRISLSRGKTIIPIKTELHHAMDYLHIQGMRYKFEVRREIDPAIERCTTIKLIVQPLLENAISHAIEMMDGDGVVTIRGYLRDGDVCIEVEDNGLGIPPEVLDTLLTGDAPVKKKGSGIGLKNVHQRIQLYYGTEYGLEIESEPDVGTVARIHLPAVLADEAREEEAV